VPRGVVIAGLHTLRDLPQLPYAQGCGSSHVVTARRPAALLASDGVVLNSLTVPCCFRIVQPNIYIALSLQLRTKIHTHKHTNT